VFYRPPGPVFLLPERRILIVAERFVDKPICSSVDLEHGLKSRGSVPFPTLPLLPLPFISHPYLWSFPTFSPYPTFPGISSFSRYGVWRIYTRRQCNVMLVSFRSLSPDKFVYPALSTMQYKCKTFWPGGIGWSLARTADFPGQISGEFRTPVTPLVDTRTTCKLV